ncbi:MAG TPA: hypothetical protein VFY39_07165 [Gammaproteobacteria bacterium]|nr:hypothetical protein [Gammaproteobacteria bacterium]
MSSKAQFVRVEPHAIELRFGRSNIRDGDNEARRLFEGLARELRC